MNTSGTASTITRHHWFVAAMLAVLVCGASFGEEAKVETNDQKLLALCEDPEATTEAIEALLKAGADVDARDERDRTPLMGAAHWNKNPTVIEFLLKAGADAKLKDNNGKTAADHAKDNEKIYKTKVYWKLNDAQYE